MRVSVIIPVYNADAFVEQAAASALDQPEVGEVLLVEDGSTDGSLAICERLAAEHEGVRLLRHPGGSNLGAGETRSLGVRSTRCGYVAFLDADDYYLSGRFEPARCVFAEYPDADGVYDAVGTHFESDDMRRWWAKRGRAELSTVRRRVGPDELFDAIIGHGGSFHTNGIVVRRELFERTGLFDAKLRMTQDFAMWIRMAAVGRLYPGSIDKPVAMRRLHGDNRIVRQDSEHRAYTLWMWRTLADWAAERGLPDRSVRKLAIGQLHTWNQMSLAERREVVGYSGEVRFLVALAWAQPECLRSWGFWKHTIRSLGASRVRGMVRK